jgi:hypothetical protein
MKQNTYSLSLCSTLLNICLFLGIMFVVLSGCSGTSKQAKTSNENVKENRTIGDLPQIGDIVKTEWALELCEHFGFSHLAERIENSPVLYKEWKFDGCSMTPDRILSEIIHLPSLTEICLRHDLGYAYGDPGNEDERKLVDEKFRSELLSSGASKFAAKVMFDAVRVGGKEELCLSFSWSFARVESCNPGTGLDIQN